MPATARLFGRENRNRSRATMADKMAIRTNTGTRLIRTSICRTDGCQVYVIRPELISMKGEAGPIGTPVGPKNWNWSVDKHLVGLTLLPY